MPEHYFWWPNRKGDQLIWLYNCLAAWPGIAATLGFTQTQIDEGTTLLMEMISVLNEVDQCQLAVKAVTEWRNEVIYGPETTSVAPAAPTVTTPAAPTINNGFFAQLKRLRSLVMAAPKYTNAAGEALGFVGPEKQSLNPALAEPDFSVTTSTGYWVNFKGSLQGFGSVNVEYQRKGSADWENIGYLNKTPGGLQVSPSMPGTAEMGMIRCRFVDQNEAVGNYSPIYPVVIS